MQVKGKAAALLACYDLFGRDNFQFGRADTPRFIWISTLEPCNLTCILQEEGIVFWFALDLERKDAVKRVFSTVNVEELYGLLARLPHNYRIILRKFVSYRPKKYELEEENSVSEQKLSDINSCIDKIRKWNWEAQIQVGKRVFFDVLSKTAFTSELKKAVNEISPLQSLLNRLAQG
jgi:hypothetical protein